ncbi:helix-turn-helix domain-containing protein [Rothia sp. LK2492]|uniref:helix-turn-helix domain-containing protein n=1 Tax=Rothia TaxID=32207 RepID=UPI00390813DC
MQAGGRGLWCVECPGLEAAKLIQAGEPATQVAKDIGMSRATLYRRIKKLP